MAAPHFENASGTIDGSNVLFSTAFAYTAGSLAVFLNGQLKNQSGPDGWTETSPSAGTFQLDVAPLGTDVVQVFYLDTAPPNSTFGESLTVTLSDVTNFTVAFDPES